MYGDDGPDDDYMTTDQALDSGWLDPDTVEELKELLRRFDLTAPMPGNGAHAALVLLDLKINPRPEIERVGPGPVILWAQALFDSLPTP